MKKIHQIKRMLICACGSIIMALMVAAISHIIVVNNAAGKTFESIDDIPYNKVGLLLATSPVTPEGAHNYYFDNRIKAAVELYKTGKIDYIIASGGDYTHSEKNGCNEPKEIRLALYKQGVPYEKIILDYDGTRTLNSILKVKQAYGLDTVTIISQKYHNERAIYLAEQNALQAIAYNADPSPIKKKQIKNTLREYLARVKLFIDKIFISSPKYSLHPQVKMMFTNSDTMMDLFYGMEKDSDGQYTDSRLEIIPAMEHSEYISKWIYKGDVLNSTCLSYPRNNSYPNNPNPALMLMIPQEEWQSLHEKIDDLTDLIEKARGSNSANEWLESEDARRILGVSPKTWQNYRDQRLIPFSQIGRKIYVSCADLDTFLRNHRIGEK